MINPRIGENFRALLDGFDFPEIFIGDSHLKVLDLIVVAKPKVFPPSILAIIGNDGIEEEDDTVSGEPRKIPMGSLRHDPAPI
jgi:hypothetical protein